MTIPVWLRGTLAGLAGGVAWMIGLILFFSPAQIILADPELQSEKFLAVFADDPGPGPRMSEMPWVMPMGLLVIGMLWGWVYVWLFGSGVPNAEFRVPSTECAVLGTRHSKLAWWKRGLRFTVVSWVLMVPWFEFYLPWNAMREPALLVALEMACWAGVMLCVGLTIAGVEHVMRPRVGLN